MLLQAAFLSVLLFTHFKSRLTFLLILSTLKMGGVLKSMLTLNEAIIDVKEG